MLQRIFPYLRSGEKIPHNLMLDALNQITDGLFTDKRRAVASSLSETAGQYLPDEHLLDFISAKINQSDLTTIINERKIFIARLQDLLPSIVQILDLIDFANISSAVHQINDSCRDYPSVMVSEYSSKKRKKILRDINTLITQTNELESLLDQAARHIDIQYAHHKTALHQVLNDSTYYPIRHIEELRGELKVLRFAAELTRYEDENGGTAFYVGDNKGRTHIVECAYRLSLQFQSPEFVTTPGSSFSILCSLIFELASGISDESLAGAINRFARSELRVEIDRDEIISRYENSDEGMREREADNFADVKQRIKELSKSEEFWRKMMSAREWDKFSESQIALRLVDVLEQREKATLTHGPHLVWASQISPSTRQSYMDELLDHEQQRLKLAIEVGQQKRRANLSTRFSEK